LDQCFGNQKNNPDCKVFDIVDYVMEFLASKAYINYTLIIFSYLIYNNEEEIKAPKLLSFATEF
jgi:hypothetical protein